jgi:flagellar motor protein MotB
MSAGKRLVLAVLWLAALGGGLWAYTYFRGASPEQVAREFEAAWDKAIAEGTDGPDVAAFVKKVGRKERGSLTARLGSIDQEKQSKFPRIPLALDAFSGYCIFRAPEFHKKLAAKGIYIHLKDDKADYPARIQGLQAGTTKLAVYTIDSLINSSAGLPSAPPAAIVSVIDESKGADAVVAYRGAIPDRNALNSPDVQLVFTKDSPSETLARVVRKVAAPRIGPMTKKDNYDDVLASLNKALEKPNPSDRTGYVIWEPDISRVIGQNANFYVVTSSKEEMYSGKIVDVLVAQKEYLKSNKETVKAIIETYFETLNDFSTPRAKADLVLKDAGRTGITMSPEQADQVERGILWRNAKQNYAHFELSKETLGMPAVPAMITDLSKLLVESGAISKPGDVASLYDRSLMEALFKEGKFLDVSTVAATPQGPVNWDKLRPVGGQFDLPAISFKRGTADLNEGLAGLSLDEAARVMQEPTYYLEIRGFVAKETNAEADRKLKLDRANAVLEALKARGVPPERMRAVAGTPGMPGADAGRAEVAFVVLQ